MKKTIAHYINIDSDILMKEEILLCELPPVGRVIKWHAVLYTVASVVEDWDKGITEILLTT